MQSMDRVDDYSFHCAELLGVSASSDTDAHNIGEKRFKSDGSISVLALRFTSNLGSVTHDWPLFSN